MGISQYNPFRGPYIIPVIPFVIPLYPLGSLGAPLFEKLSDFGGLALQTKREAEAAEAEENAE